MPKIAFMTLGCKVNQYETETLAGLFRSEGFQIVPFSQNADVYVINTCAVTHLSERKSRQTIRKAIRINPNAVVAVCGCYAQIKPDEASKIAGVMVVIGTKERARIVDYVKKALATRVPACSVLSLSAQDKFEDIPLLFPPSRTRAFLKIEDGCENFCSYCIIPYTRGCIKSRLLVSVRREAEKLAKFGFQEIVLTGIHLGMYGKKECFSLIDACHEVLAIPTIKRLRLGSLESLELSEELLALMASEKRFCAHLHLPLQSGSNAVLKRMNRHYTTHDFARLVENVRAKVPELAVSTDVIVGFPGETKEDFDEGLRFIEQMAFSRVHIFPYSLRTGTPAASMAGQISETIKKERVHQLQTLAEKMSRSFAKNLLTTEKYVLFETEADGISDGVTDNYVRVYTDSKDVVGKICLVRLEKLYRDGVWGQVIAE